MIERHVYIKLADRHANPETRGEIAAQTEALAQVPGVSGVSVGLPADDSTAAAWDLCIVVRFERIDDVEPYRVHPDHRRYVDEVLRPRIEVIKAWNFEV